MVKPDKLKINFVAVCLAIGVAACGSSGGGTASTSSSSTSSSSSGAMTLGGTVYAPNGTTLASPVGAGYDVELVEVDASGNPVGSTLGSAITASDGSYSINVPTSISVADPKYIVRASTTVNSVVQSMDARLTDIGTGMDISPITDATSEIITDTASDLTTITIPEVNTINEAITGLATDIDIVNVTSLNIQPMATANGASAALKAEANADEDTLNIINSTVAPGRICGTVTDSNGAALENIVVILRDHGNWVTRNKIKTNASGQYCLNAQNGDYVLGALNYTSTSMGASEWWHTSGTAYKIFDAEKITVNSANASGVTADFVLEPGGRITGSVTAGATVGPITTGASLENVRVVVRDYESWLPSGSARVRANGSYVMNVIPDDYMLVARNKTFAWPYATEIYDGSTGSNSLNGAARVGVTAGSTTTVDFALEAGYKMSGSVMTDTAGNGGTPVTGNTVRINNNGGGAAVRLRTNKLGRYRVWLKPANYTAQSYGQYAGVIDLTASNQTVNFVGPVGIITGRVVDTGGIPVSQAKVFLKNTDGSSEGTMIGISNADGSFTLHSNPVGAATTTTNNRIEVRFDDPKPYGSIIYNNSMNRTGATLVGADINTPLALGDIVVPDGEGLVGSVTSVSAGIGIPNASITVYSTGTTGNDILTGIRTKGDGTYAVSVPHYNSYSLINAVGNGNNAQATNVLVTSGDAGTTTTVNFSLP